MSQPRYVRKDARVSDYSSCRLCGTAWGSFPTKECPVATCKACNTPQCLGNGLGHAACAVCYIGLLPGWSGSDRPCGYKGCANRAVAFAPRIGTCCAEHALRARTGPQKITLAEYIVEKLVLRDRDWELRSQADVAGGIAMVVPILILLFAAGCDGSATAAAADSGGDAGTFETAADGWDGNTVSRADKPVSGDVEAEADVEGGSEVGVEVGFEAGLEVAAETAPEAPPTACSMGHAGYCNGKPTVGGCTPGSTSDSICGFCPPSDSRCTACPLKDTDYGPAQCWAFGDCDGACEFICNACGATDAGSDTGTAADTLPEVVSDATPFGCRGTATCAQGLPCPVGVICTVNMLRCTCESGSYSCTCM